MGEKCCNCDALLEDKNRLTAYLGVMPEDADEEGVEHTYYCEECYDALDYYYLRDEREGMNDA